MENVRGQTRLKRKALRAAVAAGDIVRSGTGRKGDPYRYAVPVPLVPEYSEERENENPEMTEEPREIGTYSRSRFLPVDNFSDGLRGREAADEILENPLSLLDYAETKVRSLSQQEESAT